MRYPRCFFKSGSRATQGSGAQGHQVANPPQQAAARKQSKHMEGRKLPGRRKANTLLPPATCCRRQPFPGPILGRPPQAPGLCLDSLLESLGGERGEADPGPCLLRPPSCALASQLLLRALCGTTPLPPSMAYALYWATGLVVCVWCRERAMEIKVSPNQ